MEEIDKIIDGLRRTHLIVNSENKGCSRGLRNNLEHPQHLLNKISLYSLGYGMSPRIDYELWGQQEKLELIEVYPKFLKKEISGGELQDIFPNRTFDAIKAYAYKLGITKKHMILDFGVLRKCSVCKLEAKSEEDLILFRKSRLSKFGRINLCNKCARERNNENRQKRWMHYFYEIKRGKCRRDGVLFNLTENYIRKLWNNQQGLCALTKIKMAKPYSREDKDFIGSLDRINPRTGYTKGNIRWVINYVNALRGSKGDEFLYRVAKAIVEEGILSEKRNN